MKTIICIQGASHTGKTSTIRDIYTELTGDTPAGGDFEDVIDYQDAKIGFFSAGDPGYALYNIIESLIQRDCIIIFCSCRSHGKTQDDIERVAKTYGYKLIYVLTYRSSNVDVEFIRRHFVSAVIDMMKSCINL